MNAVDTILIDVHKHPLFDFLKKDLKENTPLTPVWVPNDEDPLVKKESLIYQSGVLDGYLLALQRMKIKISE